MPIVLHGRRIELRAIEDVDIPVLCEWRNSERFMDLCSTRRNSVTIQEFRDELQRDFSRDRHVQMLICKGEIPIGTIYSYNFNQTDGYVFVTTFLTESCGKKGYGAEAFAVFMFYLFHEFGLHKIYTEAYSYNNESLSAMKNAGLVEEGRFCEHRLFNGNRYDLIRLAFFRSRLDELKKFVERLTKSHS